MKIIQEIEKSRLSKLDEDLIRGGLGIGMNGCLYQCAPTFSIQCALYTNCGGVDNTTYKVCLSTDVYESCITNIFSCKMPDQAL